MKRVIKLIILSLVLVMVVPIFGGCFKSCFGEGRRKAEKHCNEYLAAIPVEYEGYKIRCCVKNEAGYESSNMPFRGGQYTINEKEIVIELEGEYTFKIIYEGEETVIDKEFMANNSEAYNKISNVWKGYDPEMPEGWDIQNEVFNVFVFDDNLFILTYGRMSGWFYNPKRVIPKCLYRYDLETKKVQYCDYVDLNINHSYNLIIYKEK